MYHHANSDSRNQCVQNAPAGSAGFAGFAGTPVGTVEPSFEVAESVTRHLLNPTGSNYGLLTSSIDSLDLGLFVCWEGDWNETRSRLHEMKHAAKGTQGLHDTTGTGRGFLHLPSAKPPNYAFHLQFPEYHNYIASSDEYGKSPNVYISILAATLWHEELNDIINLIISDLSHFGGAVVRIQPSRVDLCADFKLDVPLNLSFLEAHRVSCSRKLRTILNGNDLETYYCGAATSPIQVRIYYKGLEIMISGKQWFLEIWKITDAVNVWRVEFQLRREVLHQYRIYDLDDLMEKIGAIWHYLTTEWFSLRLPDNVKAERRTIHPWWQAVVDCGAHFGENIGVRRNYASDEVLAVQKIIPHVIGRMISIAALSGIEDRKESIRYLSELLERHCDDGKFKERYREKIIKLGYRGILGGSDNGN
jgi:hypothetical protein